MRETLVNFDRNLFAILNGMHNSFFDSFFWWVCDRFIWIPFYLFLAWFLYRKFGNHAFVMILFAVILILISDQVSVLIKNLFERDRPCHDEALSFLVHTVRNKCGGQYGFVSSHAANTMALFSYIFLLTKNRNRMITYAMAVWVSLIGYARIYMGVHFPADIAGGWFLGILAAIFTYLVYRLFFNSPETYLKR